MAILKKMTVRPEQTAALVVEGGGMRGIFTAGVLDAFFEDEFDPFQLYIGVSAGACNLSSHLAGQHRRNFRIFTGQMTRPEFISRKRFFMGGHMMDLDWLWDVLAKEDPLDTAAAVANMDSRNGHFLIVATSADTGKPVYFDPKADTMNLQTKGSSAVPLLYRGFVKAGGLEVTDGGVSDPIPVVTAYGLGARRIMVIRTRPGHFVKRRGMESFLSGLALSKYPALKNAVRKQAETYAGSVRFTMNPPEDAKIVHVAPPERLHSGRTTQDRVLLLKDYYAGIEQGRKAISAWNALS